MDLVMSLGEEPYVMEDFTGENYDDVSNDINSLGFSAVNIEEQYDESDPGTILSQSIEPEDEVHPGEATLTLTVSQGLEPVEVVDYTGEPYETAHEQLTSQGFNVETSNELYNEDVPEGHIISQSPNYGDFLPGSTIQMVVSRGQEPGEKQYVQSITIPYLKEKASSGEETEEEPSEEESSESGKGDSEEDSSEEDSKPEPQTVEIFIEDKDNDISTVADSFEMTEEREYNIDLTIEEGGTASYKVVIDGETEIEEEIPY